MLAIGHVELPAMPRTGDDRPAKRSLTQRPASMWTYSVERIKLSVDIEQGHDLIVGQNLLRGSRRNITDVGDTNCTRHGNLDFGWKGLRLILIHDYSKLTLPGW